MQKKQIKDKKIAIFGLAREGVSAANFLGGQNTIVIIDAKPKSELSEYTNKLKVDYTLYTEDQLPPDAGFDYVVRSPGIRTDHPKIAGLVQKGANLTSVTKLFFELTEATIVGVTGTKGKGTTSTLIYEMLKSQNDNVFLAGNIGTPALDILEQTNEKSTVVLELSSFQLFDMEISPHVAVVLMVTSEHLDWHKNNQEYVDSKKPIVKFQKAEDFAVLNQDFPQTRSFAQETDAKVYFFSTQQETNGVYTKDGQIISEIGKHEVIIDTEEIFIPGRHNHQNASAAVAVAKIFNVPTKNIKNVLKTFKGLEHRLQLVREYRGVKIYNDSFSTTPETTIAAIEAFDNPKVLIVGGSSKNSDFTELIESIGNSPSVKTIVEIGIEGKKIAGLLEQAGKFKGKIINGGENIQQIVKTATDEASSGDVILLSPACASFDMFENYKRRGELFVEEVKKLKE